MYISNINIYIYIHIYQPIFRSASVPRHCGSELIHRPRGVEDFCEGCRDLDGLSGGYWSLSDMLVMMFMGIINPIIITIIISVYVVVIHNIVFISWYNPIICITIFDSGKHWSNHGELVKLTINDQMVRCVNIVVWDLLDSLPVNMFSILLLFNTHRTHDPIHTTQCIPIACDIASLCPCPNPQPQRAPVNMSRPKPSRAHLTSHLSADPIIQLSRAKESKGHWNAQWISHLLGVP